ncbi:MULTISPECIES: hypothetical protein [unclassified Streptomyces]
MKHQEKTTFSEIHQAMGMVNLAAGEWFEPFDTDTARYPARGFRH